MPAAFLKNDWSNPNFLFKKFACLLARVCVSVTIIISMYTGADPDWVPWVLEHSEIFHHVFFSLRNLIFHVCYQEYSNLFDFSEQ